MLSNSSPVLLIQNTGIILSKIAPAREIPLLDLFFRTGLEDSDFISAIDYLLHEHKIKLQFSSTGLLILYV